MNIWLHRISHQAEVSYPLLKKGYLSIGWSDLGVTPEFLTEIYGENGLKKFENYFSPHGLPRNRHSLWRFLVAMKKGDWVVVPSQGAFSVFEIEEDKSLSVSEIFKRVDEIKDWAGNSIEIDKDGYLCNTKKDCRIGLGFFKKVKPIATDISRSEYADAALNSRLKIYQTNANINELKVNVDGALERFREKKPINIYSQIVEKASQQILDTIQDQLNDVKFEKLIKRYFERIGATHVHIPPKNERGKEGDADTVAIFEPIKTIIYTQVKFHKEKTQLEAIEQIRDYKSQKEDIDDGYSKIAWVISTCDSFSEKAIEEAKAEDIQLFNGIAFTTMLLEAGIANLNGAI